MRLLVRVQTPGAPAADSVVDAADVVIGRTATSGFMIADPSVSRAHARLTTRDGRWWIEALSRTNPTFVNRVAIQAPRELAAGDVVDMGQASMKILGEVARESVSTQRSLDRSDQTPAMPRPAADPRMARRKVPGRDRR